MWADSGNITNYMYYYFREAFQSSKSLLNSPVFGRQVRLTIAEHFVAEVPHSAARTTRMPKGQIWAPM